MYCLVKQNFFPNNYSLVGFTAHSQATMIFHPSFFKALSAFVLFKMLPLILFNHQSVLVLGTT